MGFDKTTFWKLLEENKIVIPIIQRDFAYGRKGNEFLRENFLLRIKKALDGEPLLLDFVYGSEKGEQEFTPLDGQQRLTILWLLHWYLAYKSGKLNEHENKLKIQETLKKFSYETRDSSRDFCNYLCELKADNSEKSEKIRDIIERQTWFFYEWKQDPTINSMLTMLSGCDDSSIEDGIEKVFGKDNSVDAANNYFEKLIGEDIEKAPITFFNFPLDKFGLSDDLYVKMNARGKPLTDFENFKADLIAYYKPNTKDNLDFSSKLDNDWTDIFWQNKNKKDEIDDIYFAFINRFIFAELCCNEKHSADEIDELIKNDEMNIFKIFYGENGDDTKVKYQNFDFYTEDDTKNFSLFEDLEKILDNFKKAISDGTGKINEDMLEKINQQMLPSWKKTEGALFHFLPEYERQSITTLTLSERVVFYAVCRYFIAGFYDEESFKDWMRVVWNIVENSNIERVDRMIGAFRLIKELGEYSHEIIKSLANNLNIKSNFAEEQMKEEIEKAKKFQEPGWKEKISDAEEKAFFNGAIRFLFSDENGNVDWSDFDTKYKNAIEYFDEKGVKEKYKCDLMWAFVKQLQKEKCYILEEKRIFNSSHTTWKQIILCPSNYNNYKEVHKILSRPLEAIEEPATAEDDEKLAEIKNKDLIFEIVTRHADFRLTWYHSNKCWAFYAPNTNVDAITIDWENLGKRNGEEISSRNQILRKLVACKTIEIKNKSIGQGESLFWKNNDIDFSYEEYHFKWCSKGNHIYLADKDYKINPKKGFCVGDEIKINEMMTDETINKSFRDTLDKLIQGNK